jgi:hypothetical protein
MKKIFLVFIGLFIFCNVCMARSVETFYVTNATEESNSIIVNGTSSAYSHSFRIGDGEYFGAGYFVNSTNGTCNVTIQLEESDTLPVTEGTVDLGNYSIPLVSGTAISDIVTGYTTEDKWQRTAFSPVPMPYGRFNITGIGSNNETTIVKIKLYKQID